MYVGDIAVILTCIRAVQMLIHRTSYLINTYKNEKKNKIKEINRVRAWYKKFTLASMNKIGISFEAVSARTCISLGRFISPVVRNHIICSGIRTNVAWRAIISGGGGAMNIGYWK
jgi:hypothetical protein